MSGAVPTSAGALQRNCAVIAAALSDGRREDSRLVTGDNRAFSMSADRRVVNVPYPDLSPDWSVRTLTCGIALQCAPSKDRIAAFAIEQLPPRELAALALVEGQMALGWIAREWAGLMPEIERLLGHVDVLDPDLDDSAVFAAARQLAES